MSSRCTCELWQQKGEHAADCPANPNHPARLLSIPTGDVMGPYAPKSALHPRETLYAPYGEGPGMAATRALADWRDDNDARKERPIATHALDYFPDALAEVARVSLAGNRQHGTDGWDRTKSTDEANTLIRHFLDRGKIDKDGQRHSAKVAWRALALLQKEIEAARGEE